MNKEDLYKDHKGYFRFKDSGKLVHRWVAHKHIYLKDRKKYPLDFKEYQVHHIDKNITNNKAENLEIVSSRQHELNHNIYRHEYPLIFSFSIFIIVLLSWVFRLYLRYDFKMDWYMIMTSIIGFIALWFVNRKKKGRRYV